MNGKDGKRVGFVGDERKKDKGKRAREGMYGEDVLGVLMYLWDMAGYVCGKRLKRYIEETLPNLKNVDEIGIDKDMEEKLLSMRPATIDGLIRKEKMEFDL